MQIVKRTDEGLQVSVIGIVSLLWSKALIILLSILLGGALAFTASHVFITPKYRSSVTMYVNNKKSSDNAAVSSSDLSAAARLVETYAAIISGGEVLNSAIKQGELGMSVSQLKSRLSISAINNTEVFKISVSDPDPAKAAKLADLISEVAVNEISGIVDGSSVKIISPAQVPTEISSPSYKKYTLAGAALGFLICVVYIIMKALFDTRIKGEADLEKWGYPILGVIPEWESAQKLDDKLNSNETEKGEA